MFQGLWSKETHPRYLPSLLFLRFVLGYSFAFVSVFGKYLNYGYTQVFWITRSATSQGLPHFRMASPLLRRDRSFSQRGLQGLAEGRDCQQGTRTGQRLRDDVDDNADNNDKDDEGDKRDWNRSKSILMTMATIMERRVMMMGQNRE